MNICHDVLAKEKRFGKGERVYTRELGTGTDGLPAKSHGTSLICGPDQTLGS